MKESLKPGIKHQPTFKVPASKTVPALYPESNEFAAMPEVFATGYLVGFLGFVIDKERFDAKVATKARGT